MLNTGDRVRTRDGLGVGVVVSASGRRAIVQLDGLDVTLEYQEGELVRIGPTSVGGRSNTAHLPRPSQPQIKSLSPSMKAIEALRFGLVPSAHIDELTVGFDRIKNWAIQRFPEANAGGATASEVCGPFGSGKSHTMEAIRWIAGREGYLTARVEVDGNAVSLGDPASFLNSLWSTLTGEDLDSETPLLETYLKAIRKRSHAPRIAPRGIDRVHDNYETIQTLYRRGKLDPYDTDIEAVLSSSPDLTASQLAQILRTERALYAEEISLRPMIGRRVDDRPYDFIETLVGNAIVATAAGYKGLVITIDEFEVEHMGDKWSRIEDLIDVLSRYLKGDLDHRPAPFALFFATVGQDGHAGDALVERLLDGDTEPFELKPLQQDDLRELGKHTFRYYQSAYGIDALSERDVDRIIGEAAKTFFESPTMWASSGLTRAWTKFLVHVCDQVFGPPNGR